MMLGVPLALVAAALADSHAGLRQRPGDVAAPRTKMSPHGQPARDHSRPGVRSTTASRSACNRDRSSGSSGGAGACLTRNISPAIRKRRPREWPGHLESSARRRDRLGNLNFRGRRACCQGRWLPVWLPVPSPRALAHGHRSAPSPCLADQGPCQQRRCGETSQMSDCRRAVTHPIKDNIEKAHLLGLTAPRAALEPAAYCLGGRTKPCPPVPPLMA